MIIVTSSIIARRETIDELRSLAIEHVRRSRGEADCLSHNVHADAEEPLRLVFFETWRDRASI